jgi:site-specific recombinase XerD
LGHRKWNGKRHGVVLIQMLLGHDMIRATTTYTHV